MTDNCSRQGARRHNLHQSDRPPRRHRSVGADSLVDMARWASTNCPPRWRTVLRIQRGHCRIPRLTGSRHCSHRKRSCCRRHTLHRSSTARHHNGERCIPMPGILPAATPRACIRCHPQGLRRPTVRPVSRTAARPVHTPSPGGRTDSRKSPPAVADNCSARHQRAMRSENCFWSRGPRRFEGIASTSIPYSDDAERVPTKGREIHLPIEAFQSTGYEGSANCL